MKLSKTLNIGGLDNLLIIKNTLPGNEDNHYDTIKRCVRNADSIDAAVSYVKMSGVNILLDYLRGGKNIRLLCSMDMGITDPQAVQKLIGIGAQVRVCELKKGTFHSKMWIFGNSNKWQCLIGSSNLTYSAMFDNVETGVLINAGGEYNNNFIKQARQYFEDIWRSSENVNEDMIEAWCQKAISRKNFEHRVINVKHSSNSAVPVMFDFVKDWIDLGVEEIQKNIKDKIWRGWYIVPDHGYIDDDLVGRLFRICSVIKENNGKIDISKQASANLPFQKILDITKAKLTRPNHKMSARDLFVRQEKNYLIKLGFAFHPHTLSGGLDKGTLILTPFGDMFSSCSTVPEQRSVYTQSMENFMWNGLLLLPFIRNAISHLCGEVSLDEFNYFMGHACSSEDMMVVVDLIQMYRKLTPREKSAFELKVRIYFNERLEPTASNVHGNYIKNVKHTISVIGWSDGFKYDRDMMSLSIIDK